MYAVLEQWHICMKMSLLFPEDWLIYTLGWYIENKLIRRDSYWYWEKLWLFTVPFNLSFHYMFLILLLGFMLVNKCSSSNKAYNFGDPWLGTSPRHMNSTTPTISDSHGEGDTAGNTVPAFPFPSQPELSYNLPLALWNLSIFYTQYLWSTSLQHEN